MRACVVRGCPSSAVFAARRALDAQGRGDVREAAAAPLSSSCPFLQHHLGVILSLLDSFPHPQEVHFSWRFVGGTASSPAALV